MRFSLFAVAALLASSLAARADTITTFRLTSVFYGGVAATGTFIIDTTDGIVQSANAISTGTVNDSNLMFTSQGATTFEYFISLTDNVSLNVLLPVSTLIGYSGGNICNMFSCNVQSSLAGGGAISGTLTPISSVTTTAAVTPEPSSIALLGTGLLGIVGAMKRRFV